MIMKRGHSSAHDVNCNGQVNLGGMQICTHLNGDAKAVCSQLSSVLTGRDSTVMAAVEGAILLYFKRAFTDSYFHQSSQSESSSFFPPLRPVPPKAPFSTFSFFLHPRINNGTQSSLFRLFLNFRYRRRMRFHCTFTPRPHITII